MTPSVKPVPGKKVLIRRFAFNLLSKWRETYPVFADFKPLPIGIKEELAELHPKVHKHVLVRAIGMHVADGRYLENLAAENSKRINLDGSVAGNVLHKHRIDAQERLEAKRKKLKRKKAD